MASTIEAALNEVNKRLEQLEKLGELEDNNTLLEAQQTIERIRNLAIKWKTGCDPDYGCECAEFGSELLKTLEGKKNKK